MATGLKKVQQQSMDSLCVGNHLGMILTVYNINYFEVIAVAAIIMSRDATIIPSAWSQQLMRV